MQQIKKSLAAARPSASPSTFVKARREKSQICCSAMEIFHIYQKKLAVNSEKYAAQQQTAIPQPDALGQVIEITPLVEQVRSAT
ncbi:hypothetical protein [Rhizobium sp. AG855]|uniref:hypothetical protein n=1 Tax=Rhizobium sp. AG855 TaxID=2183898 RepID=UPI0011C3C30F|nr:hypothetical protein [Rhizobium sp. AG855]